MPPAGYTEDVLIEQPAIALLEELGWETVNAYHEFEQGGSMLGRETKGEVILVYRLRSAILRRTRDLILPKLISGEVDVSELDIAVPEEEAA